MLFRNSSKILLTALVALLALNAGAQQRDEYAQVNAKDLVKNPQLYWAQGIVFKDTMVAVPGGEMRKLGSRNVMPFTLSVAGECFAEDTVAPALQKLGPGSECIFTATIFQETFWFRKSRFRIVINEYSPASVGATDIRTGISNLTSGATSGPYLIVAQRLESILSQVQSELAAFSAESGTKMSEIFDPTGPHIERLQGSVRAAIARTEEEMRAPASVLLTDLITAILASQHTPAPRAVEPTPKLGDGITPTSKPNAESTVEKPKVAPNADQPQGEQPKPPSSKPGFWSRLFGGSSKQPDGKAAKPARTDVAPAQ